jgi:serine/threonine protein kinase/tetratricopeptide (TPR) repeat protein
VGATPLDAALDAAERALAIGDVPAARASLGAFDDAVREKELDNTPTAARSWPLRLATDRSDGRPEEVLALGSRMARKARRNGWNAVLSRILCLMGRSALDLLDFDRAQLWFEEALAAAERADDDSLRAWAILGMGMVWELKGEVAAFRQEAERAVPYAERGADVLIRAEVLTTLGRARLREGEPGGEAHLTAAEELLDEAEAHVALLKNLLDHLVLPMTSGDLDRAEAILIRAEALSELVHDRQVRGRVALDRGELYRMRGDPAAAIECYRTALDLLPTGHPVARVAQLNLALTEITTGQTERVKEQIPQLLEVTADHATFHGLAHLMALAVGPRDRETTEDDLWVAHGTPARLPLRDAGGDPDIDALARVAAERMLERADPLQAGRAAVVLGIAGTPDQRLVRAIRHARGAVPIGPFLTLERIGAGGMGEVYLGRHLDTDVPAAIKVVNPEMSRSETALRSFENELRAIAALSHPNIVRLLDHGRTGRAAAWTTGGRIPEDSPYLALEFVRGGPLSRWMGKMSWPGARQVLTDLLEALAHAHARRVLHLDLKPDNVLMNMPGKPEHGVRLTDFGLALLRDQNRDGVAGTLSFMAPEQFVGKELGTYSDLYALGCLAWGLLTDRAPFESKDQTEMQSLHALGELPPFEPKVEVPDGLRDWLGKLLEKNPRDRFTRAFDALEALDALDPEPRLPPDPDTKASVVVNDAGLSLARERQPRMVGHRQEREALWEALRTCQKRRRPMAVELRGPLGSGRRAVATWLATRAHEEGVAEVFWHDPDEGLAALVPGPAPVSMGSLAVRLLRRMDRLRQHRVAVVLLDARDPAVPEVLDILLREADGPLFFVARTPPGRLRRNRAIQRIALRPLSDPDIRRLLRSLLPLESAFENRLIQWCEGNAGLALAKVRQLAASGDLRPSRDGWGNPQLARFWVPQSVRATLEPELRAIGREPEHWEAIQVAAALGSTVDATLWKALTPTMDVVAPSLVAALILAETAPRTYRWIQPAARHLINQDRSVRLVHGRIAEHLLQEGADPAHIGRHFVAAHLYADAHRPLLDAVGAALDRGHEPEARALLQEWRTVLDRLAVSAADPRRLAGARYEARLGVEDKATPPG